MFNLTGHMIEMRAEASCGCTVPKLQKSVLLPVDGMPIEIVVDTGGRPPGVYQQVVRLNCRSGEQSWQEHICIRYWD